MALSTLKRTHEESAGEKKGSWYGLVFGVDELHHGDPKHDPEEYVTQQPDGSLVVGTTTNQKVREFFDRMCKQLQKHGECLVVFHNGHTDKACNFHGYHWHVYLHARIHPTSDARWGKELQALGRASPEGQKMYLASAVARSHALLKHILKAPRQLIWKQGEEINQLLENMEVATEEVEMNWTGSKLKVNVSVERIKALKKLMEKYGTISMNQLQNRMLKVHKEEDEDSDWSKYVIIMANPGFNQMFEKAVVQMKAEFLNKSIVQLFDTNLDVRDKKYIPLDKSMAIFSDWCKLQGFDQGQFCKDIFDVLLKRRPKINSFVLQGPPNAGKSFILRSLLPWFRWWGELRLDASAYQFAFQSCIDVGIVMTDEPVITPIQCEQMKMIMEGADTLVKCKNKSDALVECTPVFMTHNDDLYRFVSSIDKKALEARMIHKKTVEASFLKDWTGRLNPGIWPLLYKMHGLDFNVEGYWGAEDEIPTLEEQLALEESMKKEEEKKEKEEEMWAELQESTMEFCHGPDRAKWPRRIVDERMGETKRFKLAQLDGANDTDTTDSEDMSDSESEYDCAMDEVTGSIHDCAIMVMKDVETSEYERREEISDLLRRPAYLRWKLDNKLKPRYKEALDDWEEKLTKVYNDTMKSKWDFIESIEKHQPKIWQDRYRAIREDIGPKYYPIIQGLHNVEMMCGIITQRVLREVAVDAAEMVRDEMTMQLTPFEPTGPKTPDAPKGDRKRKISGSPLATCAKRLQF